MPSKQLKQAANLADRWDLAVNDVFDLAGAYTRFLRQTHTREARPGVFHPSQLGMCGRHNVYEYLGYEHDPTWASMRLPEIFVLGHKIHDFLQARMLQLKGDYEIRALNEVPTGRKDFLRDKFGIGGTSDTLLEIQDLNTLQRGVIEFKSIGQEGFSGPAGVKTTNIPKPQHLEQIHIYMYRFDCPVGWIWYYCKNTSESHIIPIVFNDTIFQEALDKVRGWKTLADRGKLPPREESWFGCRECKYAKTCNPAILARRQKFTPLRNKYAKTRR